MSWLEKDEAQGGKAKVPPPLPKPKGPPPMPKGPPPMPKGGPIRRETIDVRLDWLEEAEQAVEAAKTQRKSSTKIEAVKPKRTKQPWEPPSLPPPPPNAVKSRTPRVTLPREEPDDPPKRPSKRPPAK